MNSFDERAQGAWATICTGRKSAQKDIPSVRLDAALDNDLPFFFVSAMINIHDTLVRRSVVPHEYTWKEVERMMNAVAVSKSLIS